MTASNNKNMTSTNKYYIVPRIEKDTQKVALFFYNWKEQNGRAEFWIECYDIRTEHGQVSQEYYLTRTVPVPEAQADEAKELFAYYLRLLDDAPDWKMSRKLLKHSALAQTINRSSRIIRF